MSNRRPFLKSGLAALGYGLAHPVPAWAKVAPASGAWAPKAGTRAGAETNPLLRLPDPPDSIAIDGLPFSRWFSGDDFRGHLAIPFHTAFQGALPAPTEDIEVAVVGGGTSIGSSAPAFRTTRWRSAERSRTTSGAVPA